MSDARWTPIPGTPDYHYDALIAVYKRSGPRGDGALYWVFPSSETKRIQRNAMCVGELPEGGLLVTLNKLARKQP